MEGTYNKQAKIVLKDTIKSILFRLGSGKSGKREELKKSVSLEDKFLKCNELLGVHQSRYEVLELIRLLNERFQPKVICEIGTANSGTNLLLGSAVPSVELIIGVDLYVKNRVPLNYFLEPKSAVQLDGDSKASATIANIKAQLGTQKIDFLFIDGDHSYKGVKADFETYLPLMAENGIIAFHDIVPDFKTRFGKDTGMWVGEVPKYWKELKNQYPDTMEIIENPEQDGQGIGVVIIDNKG